jgi:ribosome-associated protein
MTQRITINRHVQIPISELRFSFARSGGHGGQNVNKVETKVELLFNVRSSKSISDTERESILKYLHSKIDSAGVLHIVAQESRSQWRNKQDAIERFTALLQKALMPRKKRVAMKVSKAAKQKRLETKKHRSKVKAMRRVREE